MKEGQLLLADVWTTYATTTQCIRIVDRLRTASNVDFEQHACLEGLTAVEAHSLMRGCRDESENFAILALWAVFERFLIDYVREKGVLLGNMGPEPFSQSLRCRFEASVENWRMDDILDLFKGAVDPRLLGDAKNVKRYRDWVAHRNDRRGHNGKTDPKFAYNTLSEIIDAIMATENPQTSLERP